MGSRVGFKKTWEGARGGSWEGSGAARCSGWATAPGAILGLDERPVPYNSGRKRPRSRYVCLEFPRRRTLLLRLHQVPYMGYSKVHGSGTQLSTVSAPKLSRYRPVIAMLAIMDLSWGEQTRQGNRLPFNGHLGGRHATISGF
jgi:hypothetical protein